MSSRVGPTPAAGTGRPERAWHHRLRAPGRLGDDLEVGSSGGAEWREGGGGQAGPGWGRRRSGPWPDRAGAARGRRRRRARPSNARWGRGDGVPGTRPQARRRPSPSAGAGPGVVARPARTAAPRGSRKRRAGAARWPHRARFALDVATPGVPPRTTRGRIIAIRADPDADSRGPRRRRRRWGGPRAGRDPASSLTGQAAMARSPHGRRGPARAPVGATAPRRRAGGGLMVEGTPLAVDAARRRRGGLLGSPRARGAPRRRARMEKITDRRTALRHASRSAGRYRGARRVRDALPALGAGTENREARVPRGITPGRGRAPLNRAPTPCSRRAAGRPHRPSPGARTSPSAAGEPLPPPRAPRMGVGWATRERDRSIESRGAPGALALRRAGSASPLRSRPEAPWATSGRERTRTLGTTISAAPGPQDPWRSAPMPGWPTSRRSPGTPPTTEFRPRPGVGADRALPPRIRWAGGRGPTMGLWFGE